jgi:isochorismate hydrolase
VWHSAPIDGLLTVSDAFLRAIEPFLAVNDFPRAQHETAVNNALLFLASDRAGPVTMADLYVDGGATLWA